MINCYLNKSLKILSEVWSLNILWGLLGIIVVFAIAFLLSEHKTKINIRTILIGLAINFVRIYRAQMGNGSRGLPVVYEIGSASCEFRK